MISIQVPQVILLELKYLYHLSLRLQSEITVKIHLPSLQNTGLKWGVIPSKIKLFRQIYVESSFGNDNILDYLKRESLTIDQISLKISSAWSWHGLE